VRFSARRRAWRSALPAVRLATRITARRRRPVVASGRERRLTDNGWMVHGTHPLRLQPVSGPVLQGVRAGLEAVSSRGPQDHLQPISWPDDPELLLTPRSVNDLYARRLPVSELRAEIHRDDSRTAWLRWHVLQAPGKICRFLGTTTVAAWSTRRRRMARGLLTSCNTYNTAVDGVSRRVEAAYSPTADSSMTRPTTMAGSP